MGVVTAHIDALGSSGEFVGTVTEGVERGKRAFVKFAAPGETVSISVYENKKNFIKGVVDEIFVKSEKRIAPACPYFGGCGGCDLQHLPADEQRALKVNNVSSTLKKHFNVMPTEGVSLSERRVPDFHYRNRVRLQVDHEGAIGFFAHESHHVIPISSCEIASRPINEIISILSQFPLYGVKQVFIREKREGLFLSFLPRRPKKIPRLPENVLISNEEDELSEFAQVNNVGNEVLKELVIHTLKGEKVYDLFAGSGNFSFPLAERGKEIIAVEYDRRLVRLGEAAAKKRNLPITFHHSACEVFVTRHHLSGSVVLDPPRAGAHKVVQGISSEVNEIVYVSCYLPSLGRDLEILQKKGFAIKWVKVVDMFPQTHHVETVSYLSR